jgi:hypothetical protein
MGASDAAATYASGAGYVRAHASGSVRRAARELRNSLVGGQRGWDMGVYTVIRNTLSWRAAGVIRAFHRYPRRCFTRYSHVCGYAVV